MQYEWVIPEDIETKSEAAIFMSSLDYIYESGDNWMLPESTYYKKGGDCEDLSGLLAHIFIYCLNLSDVKLVGCISADGPHMMVYSGGVYYEGQTGRPTRTNYIILYKMSYESYIFLAKVK